MHSQTSPYIMGYIIYNFQGLEQTTFFFYFNTEPKIIKIYT